MRGFHRGIAAAVRGHAGMGRLALDLHHRRAAALAPDHQAVGRAAGLQVQRHIVLPGYPLNQLGGALGAGFLVGIEQEGDFRVVLEVQVLEDFQRIQTGDDTALVIHDTRPVGAPVLDIERLGCRRAFLEHRVHVRHQQDPRLAVALEGRHDALARLRRGGKGLDTCPELFQFVGDDGPDLLQARLVA